MATFFLVVLVLVAALWLWLALNPAHRTTFRDVLNVDAVAGPEPDSLPPVTMIVPARNEAEMFPSTLPSWCGQDYPDLRVVLVDDQSDDGSDKALVEYQRRFPNLTVVRGSERPEGWCGKPWAVTQGVRASAPRAADELVLLTDADCVFHPRCTRQTVTYLLNRQLDMLSLVPRMTFGSTVERVGVSGLATVLSMMFPIGWVNDPKRPLALAAGGFILARRDVYEQLGGHACVKSHLIEDVSLARKLKAAGAKVEARLTRDLVGTRMYEGFADLWEGLAKNAYAGMEYQPRKFWVGMVVGLVVAVLPPAYLLGSVVWAAIAPSPAAWAALALSLLINLLMAVIHRRAVRHLDLPWFHTFFLPLSTGLYTLISISSAWQHHYRGGNLWKGRRYDRKLLLTALEHEPAGAPAAPVPATSHP